MSIKFALDIGIASVGWAVVDDCFNVVDLGTRLFESADASKNSDRRSQRSRRRLSRRKLHRISRFNSLWDVSFGEEVNMSNCDVLKLRNHGLVNELSKEELYSVLKYYMKHRGISYLEDSIEEDAKSEYAEGVLRNAELLEEKKPCEIQLERMMNFGKFRGSIIDSSNDDLRHYSNIFTTKSYMNEVKMIMEEQSKYHMELDESFMDKYMSILSDKRKYYDGPGNELSRTDYGRYTTEINPKTGDYVTLPNLFDKLIGKCSIFPNEARGSSASYTAQMFNALNDLNNITVNGRKLTMTEKESIISDMTSGSSVNVRKSIKKAIGEEVRVLTGARIDSSEKELFHKFDLYSKMKRAMKKEGMDIDVFNKNQLDVIGDLLTLNTDKESIICGVENLTFGIEEQYLNFLINFRKKNGSFFNKWHSLSLKAMRELNPILIEQSKNQMQILTELGYMKSNYEIFKQFDKIPHQLIVDDIYNPVVKRAITQSIRILNALISEYGYPDDIIIEMARDRNEQEQIKRIKKNQGKNEKELDEIIKNIKRDYGIEIKDSHFYNHKMLKTKLRLWNEQEGQCLYSGKTIRIIDLLNKKEMFEIDHIIPISISFDDSRSNKVLVYREENQIKGNKTPFMYLHGINRDWNYSKFEVTVNQLNKRKKISSKKAKNLLFMDSITKQEVVQGFLTRNINDTRYASRVVLNTLQSYMKAHDKDTKIKVIRGSFTSQLRNKLHLPKDRDESFAHHAIDAAIMCFSQMGLDEFWASSKPTIDYETGEILNEKLFMSTASDKTYKEKLFYENIKLVSGSIEEASNRVKYSHRVDKKPNRTLSNETIYGTRLKEDGKQYKISKIKDIYTKDGWDKFKRKLKSKKGTNKLDEFLMYHHDPKSFDLLLKVIDQFSDQPNPFLAYLEEYGEPIRKYSKKNNGPFIKSLKYYDGEIGSHIDISHKYGHEKGSKKVVLDSLKPYRADVYYDTKKGTYRIVGIKYASFKFINGKYILDENEYNKVLVEEKVLKIGETYKDLSKRGVEFKFSLYKNDIIKYEKKGQIFVERFLSRTMPKQLNYIETKPVDKKIFDVKKRNLIGMSKTSRIVKINTDILGNKNETSKEVFRL